MPDAVDARRPAAGSDRSGAGDFPGRAPSRADTSERADEPDTVGGAVKPAEEEEAEEADPLTEAAAGEPGTADAPQEAGNDRRKTEPGCSAAADSIQVKRKLLNGCCFAAVAVAVAAAVAVVVAAAAAAVAAVVVVAVAAELHKSFRTGVYFELSSSGTTSCWRASPAPLFHCNHFKMEKWK